MEIKLNLDKSIIGLSGDDNGKKLYNSQVWDNINLNEENIICFPEEVENVSIYFIKGFTFEMVNIIGIEGLFRHLNIKGRKTVVSKFKRAVFYWYILA